MHGTSGRLAGLALAALALLGCAPRTWNYPICQPLDTVRRSRTAPPPLDLSDARPFRSYLAVTRVEPAGHHFTVWYNSGEPAIADLRVTRDAADHLEIEEEAGYYGGVTFEQEPQSQPVIPPEVAGLARALTAQLATRCNRPTDWKLRYHGVYRTVTVDEFIPLDPGKRGTARGGWTASSRIEMDPALGRVLSDVESFTGIGRIEVPGDAQWLALPPGDATRLRLVEPGFDQLEPQISEAARRHAAHLPTPSLAAVTARDPAPQLLEPGYVARVVPHISLFSRHDRGQTAEAELYAPIELHDAVFGAGASGDGVVRLGATPYKLHATLTPDAPRTPAPDRAITRYTGQLALHVEDDRGHTWDHTYPISGQLVTEGDAAIAPVGVEIPGASAPSPEATARHAALPGARGIRSVELTVNVDTDDNPGFGHAP